MKKKFLGIIALTVVTAIMSATLTFCLAGCTQTKATDVTITEEDLTSEATDAADVKMEEIVVAGEGDGKTDGNTAFSGAEDENIVLYAEPVEEDLYFDLYKHEYSPVSNAIMAKEDIKIYNGDGLEVGYIKNGATVDVTEYSEIAWARFKNPIADAGYDYLYVEKDYVTDMTRLFITADDLKKKIVDDLNNGIQGADIKFTVIEKPTGDMEAYEFRMESSYVDELEYGYWYDKNLHWDSNVMFQYKTYSIECAEDTDGWLSCKIYYKDAVDWNKINRN